jgi:hypothetical protein
MEKKLTLGRNPYMPCSVPNSPQPLIRRLRLRNLYPYTKAEVCQIMANDLRWHANSSTVQELTELNRDLTKSSKAVSADLERARTDLHTTTNDLRQARRDHEREIQDVERRHERETNDINSKHEKQLQKLEREGERAVEGLEREIRGAKEEMEKQKRDEIAALGRTG